MRQISLPRPDDWHVHLRDHEALALTVPHSARYLGRALVMPNLSPPVTTVEMAMDYRRRILNHIPESDAPNLCAFEPMMSLYLTDATDQDEIVRAAATPEILACKLYPAGATTNSEAGVNNFQGLYPLFEAMERHDIVLSIHGEVTDKDSDIFDRERLFIDRHLVKLVERFPELRIVLEHITTQDAVAFIEETKDKVAATITAHHLLLNRNDILAGGIRPHHYCLPVAKRERHRRALLGAAFSGNPVFFLGSDSAPHPRSDKESTCGCAGIYSAHALIEICAQCFDEHGHLDRLAGFSSIHGASFYGLPVNTDTITLNEKAWTIPENYPYCNDTLTPFKAGYQTTWTVDDRTWN